MSVYGVGRVGRIAPDRTTIEQAPGFGQALDALLRADAAPSTASPPAEVRFSKHASARMQSRGISLDEGELAELGEAIDRLAARGAKESLLLMGEHAFIVGVPDRRVITALTRSEAVGNLFTQIDSTVVVR